MSVLGRFDHRDRRSGKLAGCFQLRLEASEFLGGRQVAVEQQVRCLLERRLLRKLVDGVATVAQFAGASVDEADVAAVEVDAAQPTVDLDRVFFVGHAPPCALSLRLFPLVHAWHARRDRC